MLEHHLLEIRVALWRHRITGERLPFSSREDGYVHEKWAVFTDGQSHRLLARLGNPYVAYVAAVRGADGSRLRLITELDALADIELDHTREITDADTEPFLAVLQQQADTEFKLNAHVHTIETDNERSGWAQAAPALGAAYGFITGRQRAHNAEENFWKELSAARAQLAERAAAGGAFRVLHIPSCLGIIAATAFLPFEVRPRITDQSCWLERASTVALVPALDAAARVADGMRTRKSELTTDTVLARLKAAMEEIAYRQRPLGT